jgi:hypothetical protein
MSMSFVAEGKQTIENNIACEITGVLREIFTESGVETVLYYLQINHNTTLKDGWENPSKFQKSLMIFLGEFGGTLLIRRITRRVLESNRCSLVEDSGAVDLEAAVRRVMDVEVSRLAYAARAAQDLSLRT